MAGTAVTGALSMLFGAHLLVPHGGIFVLAIPNAVTHLLLYIAAIVAGTLVTAAALYFAKKPLPAAAPKNPARRTRKVSIAAQHPLFLRNGLIGPAPIKNPDQALRLRYINQLPFTGFPAIVKSG